MLFLSNTAKKTVFCFAASGQNADLFVTGWSADKMISQFEVLQQVVSLCYVVFFLPAKM